MREHEGPRPGEAAAARGDARTPWQRLRAELRPRATRAQVAVAVLCALLGFALVVQVHNTRDDLGLRGLRQTDLVRLLDDQTARSERLRQELTDLEASRERLRSGTDRTRAALVEARQRAQMLGILAGTVRASGPGIVLRIDDPRGTVEAAHLLDAVQELRDAGAEALQIGGQGGVVRVVVDTYFVPPSPGNRGGAAGVVVDGTPLRPPYQFLVIGDPDTLAAALEIPGGVLDTLSGVGAGARVEQRPALEVFALRPLDGPQYARPASRAASAG